jgi:hypothetical protein
MNSALPAPDVVFVSYDEPNADENYQHLLALAPAAKRVHGVKGIGNAYLQAASLCESTYFYCVDGDNWVLDDFSFRWPEEPQNAEIYLWRSQNAVNKLQWFNGCIKLYERKAVLTLDANAVDFFSSMKGRRKAFSQIASETRFNATPFLAWRAAFRECAKLAGGTVRLSQSDQLLHIWKTKGAGAINGSWCVLGARMGEAYGEKFAGTAQMNRINDMSWLNKVFDREARSAQPPDKL